MQILEILAQRKSNNLPKDLVK